MLPTATAMKQTPIGRPLHQCPICESRRLEYKFVVDRSPVCGCEDCGLLFLNPQPAEPPEPPRPLAAEANQAEPVCAANAAGRMEHLLRYTGLRHGRLLLVGADRYLEAEAGRAGFTVSAFTARDFETVPADQLPPVIDACVLFCALEKFADPAEALRRIRGVLAADGALMVVSLATDSPMARFFGASWWEFNRANRFYFSVDTLQSLLVKCGFGDLAFTPDRSQVSLRYLRERIADLPRASRRHRLLRRLLWFSPIPRGQPFRLMHGRVVCLARPKPPSPEPTLAVIVPVYNERPTFAELIERVLAKNLEGTAIEVIIVESNSTDGSRDLVARYQEHPRVRIILEDKPRGKGYAVRTALKAAGADIILFQDADLEYDVDDYDALVRPILRYERNFILGSRHNPAGNGWKIRRFADSPGVAGFFNFGHLVFLTLFNVLFGQRLTDPFTMFKVFRRECLWGLTFECNRFDFDHELVVKLLWKGYKPLELPVNYRSRSMAQGKKVTVFGDPLTWIRALVKLRIVCWRSDPGVGRP
jgi:hypothetical protein